MSSVLDLFKQITAIPHCSREAGQFKDFLIAFGEKHGFKTYVDEVGNVLIQGKSPKICFQAHYDMVCIGEHQKMELVEQNGYLFAKNSTLGADNGIGVAVMLKLIAEGQDQEYLFTADEEVGLIGANNLALEPKSPNVLNLDTDNDQDIFIGCSGIFIMDASQTFQPSPAKAKKFYKIKTIGLEGGHSGLDIDKDRINGIKELASFLVDNLENVELVEFSGGDTASAIPKDVFAVVGCDNTDNLVLKSNNLQIQELADTFDKKLKNPDKLLSLLDNCQNGVIKTSDQYKIPETSFNIGKIEQNGGEFKIFTSGRSLIFDEQAKLFERMKQYFEKEGFAVNSDVYIPSTDPIISNFSDLVKKTREDLFGEKVQCKTLHTTFEMGPLKAKFPDKQFAAIGANIDNMHSVKEKAEIASIERLYKWVVGVIGRV